MKLILTESQFNKIVADEQLAQFLCESLDESKNIDSLKAKIKKALMYGVAAATIISAISKLGLNDVEKEKLAEFVNNENVVDTLFQKKVKACEKYMAYALKNQGFSLESTGLKPETLVKASDEKGFDLPFLMAAAHQESCFGATSRAKRTNSVFSEGCYDNGKNAVTFADPNQSVDSYIDLINNHYAIGDKSLLDLLSPGKFVNELGKRYAKDPRYESKIKSIRDRIIKMYPELNS